MNTTTTATTKSWRDVLLVHPAAEMFPLMNVDELRALGEDIKKNWLRSPIAVIQNADGSSYAVLDGRNRLDAMELVGIKVPTTWDKLDDSRIPVRYVIGTDADAYTYVVSVNIHRRHLTAEQKRDLIAKLVKADPTKSDRNIAEMLGVDHKTVASVRTALEVTGEIPQLTKTVGKDGKARKTKTKATTATAMPAPVARELTKTERAAVDRAFAQSEENRRQQEAVGNGVDPEKSAAQRKAEAAHTDKEQQPRTGYDVLLAAWLGASPDEQVRFINKILHDIPKFCDRRLGMSAMTTTAMNDPIADGESVS